ncbi:SAM-dependent methyltransferase [Naasia lichenicola]|uniref:SAM-dependent methyltransferase n=1 Tax=Naasia lichenicola TaxID=2565933 RepID=A0A4S4FFD7_9MICO|nr:SAM-dependent methyltransferase [Naasia lichenicola]THG28698.1 SAM-dependent methyltransferase [Naasia lichenicola]
MSTEQRSPAKRSLVAIERWLATNPSLEDVAARFPAEWQQAMGEVKQAAAGGAGGGAELARRLGAQRGRPADRMQSEAARVSDRVRSHMTLRLLQAVAVRSESGVEEGRVRFGLLNGWLLQRVFFEKGLRRKPVSMGAYRIAWPLAWERRRLMALVRPNGIYCFYSGAFVRRIAGMARAVGSAQPGAVLEIAAGDGTLTRFLRDAGAAAHATDDHSWASTIDYADDVERADARTALRMHSPATVVCSWPPPGNLFERAVFETPSVQTYIAVVGAHESEAGAWDAYRAQDAFDWSVDEELSALVLPSGRSRVLVFRRRAVSSR